MIRVAAILLLSCSAWAAPQLGSTGSNFTVGPWGVTSGGSVTDGTFGAIGSSNFTMTTAMGIAVGAQPGPVSASFGLDPGPHDLVQEGFGSAPLPLLFGVNPPVLVVGSTVALKGLNLDGAQVTVGGNSAPSTASPPEGEVTFIVPGGLAPGPHNIQATTAYGTAYLHSAGLVLPALVASDHPDVGGSFGLQILAEPGLFAAVFVGPQGGGASILLGLGVVEPVPGNSWGSALVSGHVPPNPSLAGLSVQCTGIVVDLESAALIPTNSLTLVLGG